MSSTRIVRPATALALAAAALVPGGGAQELCSEPRLCEPGQESLVSLDGYSSGTQASQLTLAYDPSVPPWVQQYIDDYWVDLEVALGLVVGPPSGTFTVTVVHDPDLPFGGTYSFGTNALTFRTLPEGYNARFFNATFAHEMVHAYSDAALEQGFTSWCAEGIAVAATGILQRLLSPAWPMDISDRSLPSISTLYDHVSQSGPEAIGGTSFLAGNVAPSRSYLAAGGVFWFLTVSQRQLLAGLWSQYGYLAELLAEIYANGDGLTAPDCLAAIGATAPYPVDGRNAVEWVEDQPVTVTQVPAGTYVYASFVSPFLNTGPEAGLEYQVFSRSGSGSVTRLHFQPVEIRAYDVAGNLVCTQTHVATPGGFGTQYVTLCDLLHDVPGAYAVEVDAAAYGAGTVAVAGAALGSGAQGYDASTGTGAVFFDPLAGRVRPQGFSLTYGYLAGAWSGASLVVPVNLWLLPSLVRFSPVSLTPGGAAAYDRTMPLPYRRFVRLDLGGS